MRRPVLLDLFCGQGGAGHGYAQAGFKVIGVDVKPQPRYPYEFIQASWENVPLAHVDAVHASPPCQAYTKAKVVRGTRHDRLLGAVRLRLRASGLPYVIENVPGAPMEDPVMLCGAMFPEQLRVYRHRLFETNWSLMAPPHPEHDEPQVKMGRVPQPGEWVQPVGNFIGVGYARIAMGMPWASREGLREAIPPAFTKHIGRQLLDHWMAARVADDSAHLRSTIGA